MGFWRSWLSVGRDRIWFSLTLIGLGQGMWPAGKQTGNSSSTSGTFLCASVLLSHRSSHLSLSNHHVSMYSILKAAWRYIRLIDKAEQILTLWDPTEYFYLFLKLSILKGLILEFFFWIGAHSPLINQTQKFYSIRGLFMYVSFVCLIVFSQ